MDSASARNDYPRLAAAARLNRWAALALRLYIGGVFIYASISKINYTAEFAEIIAAYQLVPYWGVNLMAVTLPWLELLCGFMLIIGVRARAAAAMLAALLLVFTVVVVATLLRGIPIGCGCFSTVGEPMGWLTVARDALWLAMALHVYFFDRLFHLEDIFVRAVGRIFTDGEVSG